MKMSPLTAVLKCPHYEKGHFKHESEGEAEAPFLYAIVKIFLCEKVRFVDRCPAWRACASIYKSSLKLFY